MALPDKPEQGIFFDTSSADRYDVSPLDVERANIDIFLREAKKYLDPKDVGCLSGQLSPSRFSLGAQAATTFKETRSKTGTQGLGV